MHTQMFCSWFHCRWEQTPAQLAGLQEPQSRINLTSPVPAAAPSRINLAGRICPPRLQRWILARVYYHSAIDLVCWEQDSASCRLKSTSCFCPGQGPARRMRGAQVGVFGSVLGMQRDRASGSPAAEVQGEFCLSENQIIYYQK